MLTQEQEEQLATLARRCAEIPHGETGSDRVFLDQRFRADLDAFLMGFPAEERARLRHRVTAEAERLANIRGIDWYEQACVPTAVLKQMPVGHGGFHIGAVGIAEPQIRWVYDCGARRRNGLSALRRHIDNLNGTLKGEPLDLMFVSHFDADHVAGLKHVLRSGMRIRTVVVPYLEPEDVFVVVAEALASGRLPAELTQALLAPRTFFPPDQVDRIIRLRPARIDGDDFDPDEPSFERPPPPTGEDDKAPHGMRIDPRDRDARGREIAVDSSGVAIVDPGWGIDLVVGGSVEADWAFLPHVHPVPGEARELLRTLIRDHFGLDAEDEGFGEQLLHLLASRKQRSLIKRLYEDAELGDANAVSLSLYVGPKAHANRRTVAWIEAELLPGQSRRDGGGAARGSYAAGWMLTGDAKLRDRRRLDAWRRFAVPLAEKIGVFMLPHHGSQHNLDPADVDFLHDPLTFATFDTTAAHFRPHPDVRAALGDWQVAGVTEQPGTKLVQMSHLRRPPRYVRPPREWV